MAKGADLLFDPEAAEKREAFKERIAELMASEQAGDRLLLIKLFTQQAHADPLFKAIAEMLAPVAELPLTTDGNSRKGKVAQKMGLSKHRLKNKTREALRHAEFYKDISESSWEEAYRWVCSLPGYESVSREALAQERIRASKVTK